MRLSRRTCAALPQNTSWRSARNACYPAGQSWDTSSVPTGARKGTRLDRPGRCPIDLATPRRFRARTNRSTIAPLRRTRWGRTVRDNVVRMSGGHAPLFRSLPCADRSMRLLAWHDRCDRATPPRSFNAPLGISRRIRACAPTPGAPETASGQTVTTMSPPEPCESNLAFERMRHAGGEEASRPTGCTAMTCGRAYGFGFVRLAEDRSR